jgi:DNA invertase Pin-like site-specific DNA recombinase
MKRKINTVINTGKKNFIITRISSEKEDETSLIDQRNFIIQHYGFNLLDRVNIEFIDFNGYSAFNRSYYTDTMNTLSKLKDKKFYYFCVDRFSRNVALGSKWLENIKNNNSTIYFAQEKLEYPCAGDYERIIPCLISAQQYSESISEKVKHRNQAKKQRGEFSQTLAFGCSFNNSRIYELKIIALINILKSVRHENIIELHYLKKLLKNIVLSMPINSKDMIDKIKYIDENDFYSVDDLNSEFTDLDICDLLSNYGIFIIKKDIEIEIVTDFKYNSHYFYWGNSIKDLNNKIKKYINDLDDNIRNYNLNDISSLILTLSKKRVNKRSIIDLTNKIIELNYEFYGKLLHSKSSIKLKTWLKIPDNINIPLDFQWNEPIKKKDKETKKISDILKKFNENIKNKEFKDNYVKIKQLFLKNPNNDLDEQLISLMRDSFHINENSQQNHPRKKQNIQHLNENEYIDENEDYESIESEESLTNNINMDIQPLIVDDFEEIHEEEDHEHEENQSSSNNFNDLDFSILEILYIDSYKKKGENHKNTQLIQNEIRIRVKSDTSLLSNLDSNILQIILKDLYHLKGEHYSETQDYLNEIKKRKRIR